MPTRFAARERVPSNCNEFLVRPGGRAHARRARRSSIDSDSPAPSGNFPEGGAGLHALLSVDIRGRTPASAFPKECGVFRGRTRSAVLQEFYSQFASEFRRQSGERHRSQPACSPAPPSALAEAVRGPLSVPGADGASRLAGGSRATRNALVTPRAVPASTSLGKCAPKRTRVKPNAST
jgi:hypothetical protein